MANELSVSASLNFMKDGAQVSASGAVSVDVTGDCFDKKVQLIGISREAVAPVADLSSYGYVLLKNLSSDYYITAGCFDSDSYYTVKLLPGEIALFRCNANALYAKAEAMNTPLEVTFIEA